MTTKGCLSLFCQSLLVDAARLSSVVEAVTGRQTPRARCAPDASAGRAARRSPAIRSNAKRKPPADPAAMLRCAAEFDAPNQGALWFRDFAELAICAGIEVAAHKGHLRTRREAPLQLSSCFDAPVHFCLSFANDDLSPPSPGVWRAGRWRPPPRADMPSQPPTESPSIRSFAMMHPCPHHP